jgi:transcriptional regulator with XRE-family HTH domain
MEGGHPVTRPPVAQLIYEARLRTGLSIRQAADRAGISEGSWRRTEGTRNLTRTPGTVAKMASVVAVTGDQLAAAGWSGAAEILDALTRMKEQPVSDDAARGFDELVRRYDALSQSHQKQSEQLSRLEEKLDRVLGAREHRDDKEDKDERKSRRAG